MHERLLEYPIIRIIPFPYQFGTSGNEIGKAKTQFGKQNCICEMEFQVCQFHFHLCQIDMEKVGMGLFGAADSALADSAQGLFGAISIFYHNQC